MVVFEVSVNHKFILTNLIIIKNFKNAVLISWFTIDKIFKDSPLVITEKSIIVIIFFKNKLFY